MIVKEFKKKGPVYKVQTFGTLQSIRSLIFVSILSGFYTISALSILILLKVLTSE